MVVSDVWKNVEAITAVNNIPHTERPRADIFQQITRAAIRSTGEAAAKKSK
jgi:hypothetical protein